MALRSSNQPGELQPMLVGWIGKQRYALPVAAIERVLPMAAVTSLPGSPAHILGVINIHGATLPVVAPHGLLGLATPVPRPDQHLLLMHGQTRFVLWIDRAERIVEVPPGALIAVEVGPAPRVAPFLMRDGMQDIPVLAGEAFDPGPILRAGSPAPG